MKLSDNSSRLKLQKGGEKDEIYNKKFNIIYCIMLSVISFIKLHCLWSKQRKY